MVNWTKYFDAIICLSLADNIERRRDAYQDFKRVGIADSGIFGWKITCKNEFYKYIWSNPSFNTLPGLKINYNHAHMNCTMGHYEIMKESLALGYNRVLILEDDVRFLKDVDHIEEILSNMPDYDILLFDKFLAIDRKVLEDTKTNCKINDWFFDYSSCNLLSCGCYAMSRKGMEVLTEHQETWFLMADNVTNKVGFNGVPLYDDDLKRVSSMENLAIQGYISDLSALDVYKDIVNIENYNITII